MKNVDIELNGKIFQGMEVPLPKAPLVLVHGPRGFVMCGYLDLQTADKLGVACALVRGVATVDDLLAAKIKGVSKAGAAKGVKLGMSGREALLKLS